MATDEKSCYTIKFLGIKIRINPKKNYFNKILRRNNFGKNNELLVQKNNKLSKYTSSISGLKISVCGENNKIIIDQKTLKAFSHSSINVDANNSTIIFEETDRICNLYLSICCGDNQRFVWGKGSNCWGLNAFLHEENSTIIIGEDCMFSGEISIWATDGHAVLDNSNKKAINNITTPVTIGNHAWIGTRATLLKNTNIKNNSIVGAGSVVTSNFNKSNVIIAGNPAKIVRENIDWQRETAHLYTTRHK